MSDAMDRTVRFVREALLRSSGRPVDFEVDHPASGGDGLSAWAGFVVHEGLVELGTTTVDPSWRWDDPPSLDSLRRAILAACDREDVFLRWHDSAHAVRVWDGEEVWDRDRPDRVPPPRRAFRTEPGSPAPDAAPEPICRGDSLHLAYGAVGLSPDSSEEDLVDALRARGVRLLIRDNHVAAVTFFAPYPARVRGVWLGASCGDVARQLGTPVNEVGMGVGDERMWVFDVDGHLAVLFDANERVTSITT